MWLGVRGGLLAIFDALKGDFPSAAVAEATSFIFHFDATNKMVVALQEYAGGPVVDTAGYDDVL